MTRVRNGVCKDADVQWGLPFRVFQTPLLCNHKNRGLKSPRLFIFPSFRRIFSHNSLLIPHYSALTITSSWTCFRISPNKGVSKGSQWDAETSSAWPFTLDDYYRRNISSEEAQCSLLTTHPSQLITQTLKAQRQGRDSLSLGKCYVFLKSDHTDHATTPVRFFGSLPHVKVPFPHRQGFWCSAGLQLRTGVIPRHTILCSPASSS